MFFKFRLLKGTSEENKSIIIVWLNDEFCLRESGSKHDVYKIFSKKLQSGDIPDSYDKLLKNSTDFN